MCSWPGSLPGTRARALRLLPRLSIQRTIRLPCSRANSTRGAPRAPYQIGGRITATDRSRAECMPAVLASSHFSEPTLNDAIPAGGSAAGPENTAAEMCLSPLGVGGFMINNWTKARVRGHHGLHVSVGRGAFAPAG